MDCCCLTEEEKETRKEKKRIRIERKKIREDQKKEHKKIEKILKKDRINSPNKLTLLLLGTGESGKSTFVKQMVYIHGNGFSDSEKKFYIRYVFQNMFISMQSMIAAMDMLQIEYESPNIMNSVQLIRDFDYENVKTMSASHAYALKALWADNGIQKCFSRSREYQLTDSTKYFLSDIDRIADPKYLPNKDDILRVRVQTTGIIEKTFQFNELQLTIVDVGGQRSERKKWMSLFEGSKSLIFVSALSEYDQTLYEDKDRNRLQEAVALFKITIDNCFFRQHSILLFLNKADILENKIMTSNLADYFPDYNGPERDAFAARDFIKSMFLDKKLTKKREIYTHFTEATNSKNIESVFKAVRKTILIGNLGTRV